MLKRLLAHIVVFVTVLLVIAFAPILTLAATVWMASLKRVDPDEITASVLVGSVLCAFWYMFVASVTRAARAKREGLSPRTGLGTLSPQWLQKPKTEFETVGRL